MSLTTYLACTSITINAPINVLYNVFKSSLTILTSSVIKSLIYSKKEAKEFGSSLASFIAFVHPSVHLIYLNIYIYIYT